ncbi:hypothetical protein PM082_006371 [Marasmius tenuissimus]|nr:hypothetical protein PM082_006371 [Marasmius tenuissimus]
MTFTNTATDRVFTNVAELRSGGNNNTTVGSVSTIAWQIVFVLGAMIGGAMAVL